MSEVIELPLDDMKGHLVEPPIVDQLHHELEPKAYVVTIVPSEWCSENPTEVVTIPAEGSYHEDFQRIATRMRRLAALLGSNRPVERLVHAGGGDFSFHLAGEDSVALSDDRFDSMTTFDAYRQLQDIAQTAELVFRLKSRSTT